MIFEHKPSTSRGTPLDDTRREHAFASPAARILEVSLGANPLLRELPEWPPIVEDGRVKAPEGPGLGFRPRKELVDEWTVPL